MRNRTNDMLVIVVFIVSVIGFLLGGYTTAIVKNEQMQDKAVNHNAEINRLVDEYETKLASKDVQLQITQSRYVECNKRYTEPRPIVCE